MSNICDNNDAYIPVKCNITLIGHNRTQTAFKNCSPFSKCITKIDGTTTADAEDLHFVMPLYNLLEFSSSNSDMAGSL